MWCDTQLQPPLKKFPSSFARALYDDKWLFFFYIITRSAFFCETKIILQCLADPPSPGSNLGTIFIQLARQLEQQVSPAVTVIIQG